MDMYMPACSGDELAQVIRQRPEFISIPIVYLSAEQDRQKQLLAMSHGGDDFLTKPIDPEELYATVARWAAISRTTDVVADNDPEPE